MSNTNNHSEQARAAASERLAALPRAELGHWPTPLERLDRFGAAVAAERPDGADMPPVEIWAKRDDVQGVALAGNKVRKFELILGQALAEGYDTLVTAGAAQSNSARAGAASAAKMGMDCILLLSGEPPPETTANLLLDRLVAAEVRFAGKVGWDELNEGVSKIVDELAADGRRAFAAPVGASSPLGSLGFARAFLELDAQLSTIGLEPEAIVHTTTSAGTHAGLLVGRALANRPVRLIGVDAAAMYSDPGAGHLDLARESADLIGFDLDAHGDAELSAADVEILSSQIGARYGAHTSAGAHAIDLLARTEAIIADPIYSGKGVAGLIELVISGSVTGPVVLWHTGGYHALFEPSHGTALLEQMPGPKGAIGNPSRPQIR